MQYTKKQTLEYAKKWTDIIKNQQRPDTELAEWIISESLENFAEHFNK